MTIIYCKYELENGDIHLIPEQIDMSQYIKINKDDGKIILKKITNINIISLSELRKFDFANSIIIYAKINDIKFDKLKYKSILNLCLFYYWDGTQI